MLRRLFRVLAILLIVVAIGLGLWLYFVPPNLLRVGSGYAAKIVCSNVFIAKRDADQVLTEDVQSPGHPLLRLMRVEVDRDGGRVHAALLGAIAPSEAVYREGTGCSVVKPGASLPSVAVQAVSAGQVGDALWPEGGKIESDKSLAAIVSDVALTGPGMRATVVVRQGRILAEAYGDGFSAETPLLGWSMAKTVNAAIIGRLIGEGRMSLEDKGLFAEWRGDGRAEIRIADLMGMESGLGFNENYGTVADVTRMLFIEPDMARYAASLPLDKAVGSEFRYSSGTSMLLSKLWMERFEDAAEALAYPNRSLFDPLGMASALMETDEAGTYVGSSYMYATARDWARFGLFLARDGVWNGERLLPEGFVAQMHAPNHSSGGRYSKLQTWLPRPDAGLPADAFFLSGHDGQYVFVIPSLDLVVVRMGLTPRRTGYDAVPLVKAVIKAGLR